MFLLLLVILDVMNLESRLPVFSMLIFVQQCWIIPK